MTRFRGPQGTDPFAGADDLGDVFNVKAGERAAADTATGPGPGDTLIVAVGPAS